MPDTPASRARAHRDPAVALPPRPPQADRQSALEQLSLVIAGRPFLIGPNVEGDPGMDATKDAAATVNIAVRDTDGTLAAALADEALLLQGAVTVTINGVVYVVQSAESDDTGLLTLTVEDQVAWRLRQFDRFRAVRRSKRTRAQFIAGLVDEASAPPLAPMRFFCPQIDDRQRIAAPTGTA